MLPDDIKEVDNFGRFDEIAYVLGHILTNRPKYIEDIKKHALEDRRLRRTPIQNILSLLLFLKLVQVVGDQLLLSKKGLLLKDKFFGKEEFKHIFTIMLIKKILNDEKLNEVFRINNIEFNLNENLYSIKHSKIPLRLANFRNLLVDMSVFKYLESNHRYLFINDAYLSVMRGRIKRQRKKKSLEQMKRGMARAERLGVSAELLILDYEKSRLRKHQKIEEIKIISDIDVTAGYDIVSFDSLKSESLDRFIEVKSFGEKKNFYWSENEINISKRLKEKYFLYLVDRTENNDKEYKPVIIKNPYEKVYLNEDSMWIKHPTSWYFEMIIL